MGCAGITIEENQLVVFPLVLNEMYSNLDVVKWRTMLVSDLEAMASSMSLVSICIHSFTPWCIDFEYSETGAHLVNDTQVMYHYSKHLVKVQTNLVSQSDVDVNVVSGIDTSAFESLFAALHKEYKD
jgi:hypothetical protein